MRGEISSDPWLLNGSGDQRWMVCIDEITDIRAGAGEGRVWPLLVISVKIVPEGLAQAVPIFEWH